MTTDEARRLECYKLAERITSVLSGHLTEEQYLNDLDRWADNMHRSLYGGPMKLAPQPALRQAVCFECGGSGFYDAGPLPPQPQPPEPKAQEAPDADTT